MQRFSSRSVASVCLFLFAVGSAAMAFTGSVTVTPTRANLGQEAVGLKTRPVVIQVTNGTNKGVSVTSIALTGSQFQLTQGIAPIVVGRGTSTTYTILFAPTVTGRATGTFTITLSNQTQPLTVSLMGTGVVSTAVASPSATSLTFGPIEQGLLISQQFTLTNTGAQSFGLRQVITDPPFSNDPVAITTVAAGASISFNVYFSPTTVGSFTDNMILDFDTVPQQAIALSGSSTAPSTLAVTTSNLLPAATQSAAYSAPLAATLGTPPYTWAVQSGSTLPSGLTISTSGIVSGTVASTVTPGSYNATIQVTDSSVPPLVTPKLMTIPVGAPTGAACNNIVTNSTEGTGPLVPIDVLGTGTYFGSMGGLYDLGSNVRPADHDAYGVTLAQSIQALDANGIPDPNGKKVFLIIGESNVEIEAEAIVRDANLDAARDPHVVVVNGGMGNETSVYLQNPNSGFWSTINNFILPNYGVTPAQVVAIWAEPNDAITSGTYPTDISAIEGELKIEIQNFLLKYPNLKMAYLSSRTYSGYSNGISKTNPEPYAYEVGFAMRDVILDQINGDLALNFDPSKGTVVAPWLSWGPYYWADGLTVPSGNGTVWSCQDSQADGTHPGRMAASEKVANAVLNMLHTDTTASPWYLTPPQ